MQATPLPAQLWVLIAERVRVWRTDGEEEKQAVLPWDNRVSLCQLPPFGTLSAMPCSQAEILSVWSARLFAWFELRCKAHE